jgi:hypothetical protein
MIATQKVMNDLLARIEYVSHVIAMVSACLFLTKLCHYARNPISRVAGIMHDAKYFVQLHATLNQGTRTSACRHPTPHIPSPTMPQGKVGKKDRVH